MVSKKSNTSKDKLQPKMKKAVTKIVKQQISKEIETKFLEVNNGSSFDYNGTIYDLSAVTAGTGDSNRIGDKITPKSLKMNASITPGDSINVCRFLVFRWHPSSVTDPPTIAKLFGAGPGSGWAPYSHYNHDGRTNFSVLMDRFFYVGDQSKQVQLINKTLRLASKPISYIAGSTNRYNGIYLAIISDSGAAPNPSMVITFTLNYDDA